MKTINLSRHVVIKDEKGESKTYGAGRHTLPSAIVSKIETAAKDDPRTSVEILKTLTPAESRSVTRIEAAKAEQETK